MVVENRPAYLAGACGKADKGDVGLETASHGSAGIEQSFRNRPDRPDGDMVETFTFEEVAEW